MPIVVHDVGPLDICDMQTFLDIQIEDGSVRLSSDHDEEPARMRNRSGCIHCIELALGVTGRRFAKGLS